MNAELEAELIRRLTDSIPRELVVAVDENFRAAAKHAYKITADRHEGHRASALGQERHFSLNEALANALGGCDIAHTEIKGTGLVVGTVGSISISRFTTNHPKWTNKDKSARRLELVQANRWLEDLIQPSLLDFEGESSERLAIFFVTVFAGQAEEPSSINLVVPDVRLRSELFCQSLFEFRQHYSAPAPQVDAVKVHLKKSAAGKKTSDGQT
ncbi:hypothetical protein [Cupriavidus sp. CuC1]|uniref:hypothetical protein n=1 Tax=Cupriavidus sp. CuC1 TaxID=3373131 RepID=UPI0037D848A6